MKDGCGFHIKSHFETIEYDFTLKIWLLVCMVRESEMEGSSKTKYRQFEEQQYQLIQGVVSFMSGQALEAN